MCENKLLTAVIDVSNCVKTKAERRVTAIFLRLSSHFSMVFKSHFFYFQSKTIIY